MDGLYRFSGKRYWRKSLSVFHFCSKLSLSFLSTTFVPLHNSLQLHNPRRDPVTYHTGIINFESRFSHKVVIRLESYLQLIRFWCYSWRNFLVPTPSSSDNSANFRYIFYFHKVVSGAGGQNKKWLSEYFYRISSLFRTGFNKLSHLEETLFTTKPQLHMLETP